MPRHHIPHKIIDGVEHKRCNICKEYKTLNGFYKNNSACDGLQSRCINCRKSYYGENIINTRKRSAQHYVDNKERYAKVRKKYYMKNKKAYKIRSRLNKRKLRKEDPFFALKDNARRRIRSAFQKQGLQKNSSTVKLIGCSLMKLRNHMEKQFDDYMTWENRSKWHVDHRVPCKAFDLSNPLHQRVCFWYKNLQPLYAKYNLKKSDKYKEEDKQQLIKDWIFFHI